MDQEILNSYSKLNSLNVSRETYFDFELFISMIIEKNKENAQKALSEAKERKRKEKEKERKKCFIGLHYFQMEVIFSIFFAI